MIIRNMKSNRNAAYYIITIGIFLLLKYWFALTNVSGLTFLLKPMNLLLELITGQQSVYMPNDGYHYPTLNIVIDKSCSGFNFWLLCFLMLAFLIIKNLNHHFSKIVAIPIVLILSYLITIFTNTSRIFASIIIQQQANQIFIGGQHLIHESIGIITNLTFLILTYFLTENFLFKKLQHAKLA